MDKYWPVDAAEAEPRVSLLSEPILADAVELRPGAKQRSLHAVLVESLNATKALLTRLESSGACVPRQEQREIVRLLYVATRQQVKALAATLELDRLE
jgi:hypothetical protein